MIIMCCMYSNHMWSVLKDMKQTVAAIIFVRWLVPVSLADCQCQCQFRSLLRLHSEMAFQSHLLHHGGHAGQGQVMRRIFVRIRFRICFTSSFLICEILQFRISLNVFQPPLNPHASLNISISNSALRIFGLLSDKSSSWNFRGCCCFFLDEC